MLNDDVHATGRLLIEIHNSNGELISSQESTNLVVTVGLGLIATAIGTGTVTAMTHMAVGSNATAAALGNTTLGTELGRVALTSTTVTGPQIVYIASFPAGTGTGALTEVGLFNATPAGSMLARSVFTVVNKAAGDSLTVTWTITVG